MEDIQLLDDPAKEGNELKINELTKTYLTAIYKWAKFFAVMGFIGVGIMFIGGLLFMIVAGNVYSLGAFSPIFGILYIILAGIYIPPAIFLNKFSGSLKNAIEYTNNSELQIAFENLKSLFKYFGIFTIVIISIYILAIFGGIIAGIITAMML